MSSAIAYITNIERRVTGLLSAGHCPVFKAVACNLQGEHESVFVKFVHDRGLFNELLASQVGRFLQLPVADTYLCACPYSLLEYEKLPFTLSTQEYHLGVASVDANQIRFRGENIALLKLEDELLSWPNLVMAAIFDELIINDDRHYQNILKIASNKFTLIDHEQAFGGLGRKENINDVFCRPSKGNYLANLIFRSGHELTKRRLYNLAQEVGEKMQGLSDVTNSGLIYLEGKLEGNCTVDMVSLIKSRAKNLQELIHQHESSEQLFALSSN